VDTDSKTNANGINDRITSKPASPKPGFNFSFANFGTSSTDIPPKDGKDARPENIPANHGNTTSLGSQFTKPYVGILGHWVGVLDLLSTAELHSSDSPQEFGDDANRTLGTSISRLSEDSMNNLCVSKTVDDISLFFSPLLLNLTAQTYHYLIGKLQHRPASFKSTTQHESYTS
jgi:hypothetical protein